MSDNNTEPAPTLGTPTGHGQRIAYLYAVVAANQARARGERLDAATTQAQRQGEDAVAALGRQMLDAIERADTRLETIPWHNRAATVATLADALVWRHDSKRAAERLNQLTEAYAQEWGVVIDPEQLSVEVDPQFDPAPIQDFAEAACLWARESAAIDIVTALPLPDNAKAAATQAVMAWRGTDIDPADPRAHLRTEQLRRDGLSVDLAAAQLTESDRARIEFVVDYLRADTSQVDLLASPVVVDPGEEARSRVPALLELFARNPKSAPRVGEEIAVMTAADQMQVRDAGRAIAAGHGTNFAVWPGYVDRYEIRETMDLYADDADELRGDADYIVETDLTDDSPELLGVSDDIGERITRMAAQREQLLAHTRDGKGLTAMERAQIVSTVEDIDTGRIRGHEQLPGLLFADERTKADVDYMRASEPAARLATATREAMTQLLEAPGAIVETPSPKAADMLKFAVSSIGDSIYTVASGMVRGLDSERKTYIDKRTRLGQALREANVFASTQDAIGQLIDGRAREAGEIGRAAAERREQWKVKTDKVIATRDDIIAQREAVAAGASSTPRACTARRYPERTPAQHPAVAGPGRRNLHGEQVGR
ncbi:hypothetical protein AB0M22_44960 [Nocardia sp. NPDC051756]|uniref:hypothetical protein n=1 Tax=Nocardia sp. NPDC051756 TaxID=3154751 RepID=UPI003438EDC8